MLITAKASLLGGSMNSTTYSRKLANIESYQRRKHQDQYLRLSGATFPVPEERYQTESQASIFENDKRMQQVLRKYQLANAANVT